MSADIYQYKCWLCNICTAVRQNSNVDIFPWLLLLSKLCVVSCNIYSKVLQYVPVLKFKWICTCSCRPALMLRNLTVYASLELLAMPSFLYVVFTWCAEMFPRVSWTFHLKTLYNLIHSIDRQLFFSLTEIPSLDAFCWSLPFKWPLIFTMGDMSSLRGVHIITHYVYTLGVRQRYKLLPLMAWW